MGLYRKTATELIDMLGKKLCSPEEILSSLKKRIAETEPYTKAYITLPEDPIADGLPVAVKDNIAVRGQKMTCGSKMLADYISPYDATAVRKMAENGMTVYGKTNMDEFAMGSTCQNSYFQTTCNPWGTSFSPGGSSGGSAAAVACGSAIIALGSDTGGSVRQPAALCGCVGFKPSYGAVSRYGLTAFASSLEQIGIISRTVADSSMLMDIISGKDTHDATTCELPLYEIPAGLNGLRIGVLDTSFSRSVEADVAQAVSDLAKLLEKNGAVVSTISIPELKYSVNAYYIISSAEASSNLSRFDGVRYGHRAAEYSDIEEMYERTRSEGFGKEVKRRIMLGSFVLSEGYYDSYYMKAMSTRKLISRKLDECFANCDVIISPVYPVSRLGFSNSSLSRSLYDADMFTVPANLAGLPAISLPVSLSADGMPVGIQLMSARYTDHRLLRIAGYIEKMYGGFNRIAEVKCR